jgi:hypothetical protein
LIILLEGEWSAVTDGKSFMNSVLIFGVIFLESSHMFCRTELVLFAGIGRVEVVVSAVSGV